MKGKFTRRDFLKLGALSLAGLAFNPYFEEGEEYEDSNLVRVAVKQVSIHKEPDENSEILFQRYRDEVIPVYYEVVSDKGPKWNPVWYRVWGGYLHRGFTQPVKVSFNKALSAVAEQGQPMEVTVPYSQSMRWTKYTDWQPVYRLYYGSVHWVEDIEEGPDGEAWYKIRDDLLSNIVYHVPASHLRPITHDELTPITPEVPLEKKRIEISIVDQTLTCFEYDEEVLHVSVSTGLLKPAPPGQLSTGTPKGDFRIASKMPSKHMGIGQLTNDPDAYELIGVPWVSFFETNGGFACHGTYWHTNYGQPMSHGCVNLQNEHAKWLYCWSAPVIEADEWQHIGFGTSVYIY